jgi:hypothetical protein
MPNSWWWSRFVLSHEVQARQHVNYLKLVHLHPLPDLHLILPPPQLTQLEPSTSTEEATRTRPSRSISQVRKLKQAVSGSRIKLATLPKLVEYLTSPYSHGIEQHHHHHHHHHKQS